MLLYILEIHLLYNVVAAGDLLERTDKNIIFHFLATEVAFIFIAINFYSEKH